MPYVSRNEGGAINGLYANAQPGYAEEYLPDDNSEVVAFTEAAANLPLPPDANARIDDGVTAALTTVVASAQAIHAIPHGGAIPARFEALLLQAAIISDAFVAMLQAQAAPMVPPAPPPP